MVPGLLAWLEQEDVAETGEVFLPARINKMIDTQSVELQLESNVIKV